VTSTGTKTVHRILQDLTSLSLVEEEMETSLVDPELTLHSNATFLPDLTVKDPAF